MTFKEYLMTEQVKQFETVIDGVPFEGEMNDHGCWDITCKLPNGVKATFKTPPRWAYTRVMQFIGNLVEARVV